MNAVTLLHAHAPRPLAKTWTADGAIDRYPNLKTFSCTSRPVGDIRELSAMLAALEGDPCAAIIRGELREGVDIDPGKVHRNNDTFEDVPRPWLALDVDDFEPNGADPVMAPASAVEEFLAAHLPEFIGAAYHWQLTGSAGHHSAAGKLKARVWFWLEEPRTARELKAWSKDRWPAGVPFDPALFGAVQLHYTAAPVFETGVADPVPVRSGFVEGATAVSVPLVEKAAVPAVKRKSVGDVSDAYARRTLEGIYRDIEEAPPGGRNGVLYQKAYRAFSLVHDAHVEEAEVRAELEAAASACGLEAEEIAATLNSAWSASEKDPDTVTPLAGDTFEGECPPGVEEQEQRAQTDRIVAFVRSKCELFHDDNDAAYARDRQSGEVWGLGSRAFRNWLTATFYAAHEKAVRDQALREARMTLEGLSMQEHRPVYVRTAGAGGDYWLDLGIDHDSRAIHLQVGAWSVDGARLMFCRSDSAQPLPVPPTSGGSIEPLWRIANVPSDARLLVVAWLVECLRPDTPYPVLELLGEHGSAKSTAQAALRRLIDPNAADLRGTPKSAEDLFISGGANHIISLENVSHLPAPLQDAMCVVATGGGFAKRKLYTDGEEVVITMKRPIILNGIAASVTQQDLVSRTLSVEMPVIQSAQAKDKLDAEFDANRAHILGGLLDIAAKALEHLPGIELPAARRPRLVEFAYLGMAVAKAMGHDPEDFMRQFEAARQDGLERTLEASPVATAIRTWAADYPKGGEKAAGQWLAELVPYRPSGTDAWPKSAKGLGDAMRRAAPALRGVGVECRPLGNIGGYVKWRIARLPGHDFMTCKTLPRPGFMAEDRHPLL